MIGTDLNNWCQPIELLTQSVLWSGLTSDTLGKRSVLHRLGLRRNDDDDNDMTMMMMTKMTSWWWWRRRDLQTLSFMFQRARRLRQINCMKSWEEYTVYTPLSFSSSTSFFSLLILSIFLVILSCAFGLAKTEHKWLGPWYFSFRVADRERDCYDHFWRYKKLNLLCPMIDVEYDFVLGQWYCPICVNE